jgi:hypothetical protein
MLDGLNLHLISPIQWSEKDKDKFALWFMYFREEIAVPHLSRSSLLCEISRVILRPSLVSCIDLIHLIYLQSIKDIF